ncbi:7-cyano-7-deazaguanine synthase [Candidatus Chloroploca sp. M-50]|uniref:7-cyano-7-deazaguanine synthase n=1 Tax=Candidatus Chloroploca mongolica TaxID=2528176 RepID=A0ABS4DA05_9CHLR|nr:7-cyano-7-deazaguanine synthase [Candidatus Chloroploca mongolica]MBP1466279.1 7-cyano-7-deazaguanine synthase [Candidatus Chloroploca mongolica]
MLSRQISSLQADLVDLAIAVHVADRFAIGRADFPRRLHIKLPLRHRELFEQPVVSDMLRELLYWYTEDKWDFEFTSRQKSGRCAERQGCLDLSGKSRVTEVALWSGGLDSLSGLVNRMACEPSKHYLLFGSGSNSQLHFRQRDLAVRLAEHHPQRVSCTQVIYRYTATNIPRNRNQRARGFVFMLLGAVCALLADENQLHIYENGVGAINLPFRASEVGLDHTRAVHPISLTLMSEMVSQIISASFSFVNPFIFWTKADMCRIFHDERYYPLIVQTVSCDRLHREVPSQCGVCSSCILRKQSLLAAGVQDETKYLFPSIPEEQGYRPSIGNHLRAMLWQVQVLRQLLSTDKPWDSLASYYPRMMDIIDRITLFEGLTPTWLQGQFAQMYQRYVDEWEQVRPYIERGLLGEEELREAA